MLDNFEACFKKYSFPMRGRSRKVCNQQIQLVNVGIRKGSGPLRAMIGDADSDEAALPVLRNRGVFVEFGLGIFDQALAINLSQIELLYEAILNRLALQHPNEKRSRGLQTQQISRH